ncbi:hypothetical protein [Streptomyces yerevanensis]|uniref:hypothetical protein n=1 Tax=Streptomyces yerevanensis TaxID=66378 RepID=UPI000527D681|nr:hypothetical protein [Streptomyces yerevanensis]
MSDDGGGGGGGDGRDLQVQGLGLITEGITLALDELRELGMIGTAGAGRGFSDLALSGLELGHGGVTSALDSFCERWEWGVRSLIDEGNNFAQAVGLSAGTFHETDQYVEGTLKIATNAMMGNPNLTEDEVKQMGWGDLAQNHMLADPDYSAESFQQARDNIKQGWQQASDDVMTSEVLGTADRQFVPLPEESAAAGEAQTEGQKNGDAG